MVVRTTTILLLFIGMSFSSAQEFLGSTIESEGIATVDSVPDHIEFTLTISADGDSLQKAAAVVAEFDTTMRDALAELLLKPSNIEISALAISNMLQGVSVKRTAVIRFPATGSQDPDAGAKKFAELCDKVRTLATTVGATSLSGPRLGLDDSKAIELAAIARAVENAYYPAEAAADILRSRITSVDKVSIQQFAWNEEPDSAAAVPTIGKITCTAKVVVRYAFEAAP